MGGPGSGTSRKRRTLPRRLRNGGLDRLDQRAAAVRAIKEGAAAIIADRGGEPAASLLATRMAHRVMHLDQLLAADELRLAAGLPVDRVAYVKTATIWLRYAATLGLARVARPALDLHQYMAARASTSPPTLGGSEPAVAPAAGPGGKSSASGAGAEEDAS